MEGPYYNLKAVVQKTGIPAASLRAWEKRYGLLEPVRKPNGHRVYPHTEIEKLLTVKALLSEGLSISQAAERVRRPVVTAPVSGGGELQRLRQALLHGMAACDIAVCNRTWTEALDLLTVEEVCIRVIHPLLPDLTSFGCTYLRMRLGALLLHSAVSGSESPLFVPAPDPADLRPLLVAVLLARQGRSVIYVEGADLPEGLKPAGVITDPDEILDRLV